VGDILLIDDDPDIRMLVRMALEMDGHEVQAAGNGLAGLDLLRASVAQGVRPVVVLDVQMPDIDGWEVLSEIRSAPDLGDIPVVMCTVRAGAADRERGYGLGADAYEAKPFDLEQLLETIRRLDSMELEELHMRRETLAKRIGDAPEGSR